MTSKTQSAPKCQVTNMMEFGKGKNNKKTHTHRPKQKMFKHFIPLCTAENAAVRGEIFCRENMSNVRSTSFMR